MTSHAMQVVQFVHPGFEYRRPERFPYPGIGGDGAGARGRTRRSGLMGWKPGRSAHDRKFMLTLGSLFDPETGEDHISVPLTFWGEWEAPSVFWRVESPGKPLPSFVHAPFRPMQWPDVSVQNTDPMVFGDAFIYSNCLQGQYRILRNLAVGSLVLFGRYARADGRPSFSLDTCLVVDRAQTLTPTPVEHEGYGADLLADAVLSPLYTEGTERDLIVYFGRQRLPGDARPFSFFPARRMQGSMQLFARPELETTGALREVISPANMQGIKVASGVSESERDAIWNEVAQQVSRQGCGLGNYAAPPPLLDSRAAESATERDPMPLT